MGHLDARAAATRIGCKFIDHGLTLSELNQILHSDKSSDESNCEGHLFADFALGQLLGAVAVIGTKEHLLKLSQELAL